MEKEKCKVSFKQYVESKEALRYLEELVKGFKSGSIVIQQGEESVALTPPDMVELEVEAKQKKDKSKFVLELSWKTAPAVAEESKGCCSDADPMVPAAKPAAEMAEKKPAEAPAKQAKK